MKDLISGGLCKSKSCCRDCNYIFQFNVSFMYNWLHEVIRPTWPNLYKFYKCNVGYVHKVQTCILLVETGFQL